MRKIIISMPDGGEAGCVRMRYEGEKSWVEFRGPPYSKWEVGDSSKFEFVHSKLSGPQASVLHAGDNFTVLPEYVQYDTFKNLLSEVTNGSDAES